MKCKSCGNDVTPKMSGKQIVLTVFLCIFGILLGVLYAVICRKTTCPVCKKNVYIKENK
jgi:hypothetical protein